MSSINMEGLIGRGQSMRRAVAPSFLTFLPHLPASGWAGLACIHTASLQSSASHTHTKTVRLRGRRNKMDEVGEKKGEWKRMEERGT